MHNVNTEALTHGQGAVAWADAERSHRTTIIPTVSRSAHAASIATVPDS